MTVTIKTKGVFDPQIYAAGWGSVTFAPGDRRYFHGGELDGIAGQTQAELAAMNNGIASAINLGIVYPASHIELATDCREGVAVLLMSLPGASCLGPSPIRASFSVRRGLRESTALAQLLELIRRNRLTIGFLPSPANQQALEAARVGLATARRRAS